MRKIFRMWIKTSKNDVRTYQKSGEDEDFLQSYKRRDVVTVLRVGSRWWL